MLTIVFYRSCIRKYSTFGWVVHSLAISEVDTSLVYKVVHNKVSEDLGSKVNLLLEFIFLRSFFFCVWIVTWFWWYQLYEFSFVYHLKMIYCIVQNFVHLAPKVLLTYFSFSLLFCFLQSYRFPLILINCSCLCTFKYI